MDLNLIFTLLDMDVIVENWSCNTGYSWCQAFLLGVFFWGSSTIFCAILAFVRTHEVIMFGYPKRKRNYIKKKISQYSFWDRALLLRLVLEAERTGIFLWIVLFCHWLNIISFFAATAGFVGMLLFPDAGWAVTLAFYSVPEVFLITGAIELIPILIWVPSERKRVFRK